MASARKRLESSFRVCIWRWRTSSKVNKTFFFFSISAACSKIAQIPTVKCCLSVLPTSSQHPSALPVAFLWFLEPPRFCTFKKEKSGRYLSEKQLLQAALTKPRKKTIKPLIHVVKHGSRTRLTHEDIMKMIPNGFSKNDPKRRGGTRSVFPLAAVTTGPLKAREVAAWMWLTDGFVNVAFTRWICYRIKETSPWHLAVINLVWLTTFK